MSAVKFHMKKIVHTNNLITREAGLTLHEQFIRLVIMSMVGILCLNVQFIVIYIMR